MPITLEQLCDLLNPSKTALLLGAGASVPSGAPTGAALARKLWAAVARTDTQSEDLIETTSILERRFGRKAVVDAVIAELRKLQPVGGMLGLPAFQWKEIFTTNFDQLVERAYETRGIGVVAMRSNYDLTNRESLGKTTLYKIHGCITQDRSLGDKASMILTEDDYSNHSQFRQSMFTALKATLLHGDVLVLGQSLRDRHLSDLVKEVLNAKLEGAPGQVYVLVYDPDDLRAPLLEDRGARVAFGEIDKFVDILAQGYVASPSSSPPSQSLLPTSLIASVIDVGAAPATLTNAIRMFNGGSATYADIRASATFERSQTLEIVERLDKGILPFIVVTGSAGVGKSTFCRQLLVHLERKGFQAWEQKGDYPFRHEHWLKVESELRQKGQRGVLFLDEFSHYMRAVNQFVDHIAEISEPALRLVMAANSAQWTPRIKSPNFFKKGEVHELNHLSNSEIYSLINLVEFNSEIASLVHSSFKSMNRSEQFAALRQKASADMFVCLKNIFANESLDTILLTEYEQLDPGLKDYYRYVAALEAVGMRVHRHLLIRMLNIPPLQISAALGGLTGILEEYDIDTREGLFGWRTRHLVIARKITDYKFSGAVELVELFNLIVENISPSVSVERYSISQICDSEFGIGRIADPLSRIGIYRRLIKIAPAERVPWHRLVRELLSLERIDEVEYAIRDAEAAVGSDGPLDRYRVKLLVLRAEKTAGIAESDRNALLRRAYEFAMKNCERRPWDRLAYRTLCDVALTLRDRNVDKYLLDEAISRMREASNEIADPEMARDLQRFESARARH